MAKLYFKYAPMEAGKSLELLKTASNYEKKGRKVLLFIPANGGREKARITSRVGLSREAYEIQPHDPTFIYDAASWDQPHAILIDEAQFLTRETVEILTKIVDELGISVLCYGLKNDFKNELFEGAAALLAYADKLEEIRTICSKCERKALMNLRLVNGYAVVEGEQKQVGDEEYISVCRSHYKEAISCKQNMRERGGRNVDASSDE